MSPSDEPHVEAAVRGTAARRGIDADVLIHAAASRGPIAPRVAASSALLDREETFARLNALITFLAARK